MIQPVGRGREDVTLSTMAGTPDQVGEAGRFIQPVLHGAGMAGDQSVDVGPNAMTPYHDAGMLKPRQYIANRGPADIETLAEFGF